MAQASEAKLVPPGQGKTIKLYGVQFEYKVVTTDSGGQLTVMEVTIPPKTLVKPHTHSREDEYTLVLSGTVGVRVGDDVVDAPQGGYMIKPRGIPHAMWNATDQPATVIEMLTPGGLEGYFEQLGPVLAHEGGRGAKEYYELAEEFGLTINDEWIEELETTYGVKL